MIHNEAKLICDKLRAIDGVKSVTRGWPRHVDLLPCIALSKAEDTPVDFRDDRAHLCRLEYYIRIFTERAQEADCLSVLTDAVMEELGYMRTFSYDDDGQDVRMAVLRYRRFV